MQSGNGNNPNDKDLMGPAGDGGGALGDGCWLAAIENDYLQSIGAEPDYEHQYQMERDAAQRGMWGSFQESATSIAQLYRDRLSTNETGALWLPFQTAAGTVTSLYKESSDGLRRTAETAHRAGYQRRTRDLADWARKKNRRYIRRDELLAYLAGRKPGGTSGTSSSSSSTAKPPAPASVQQHQQQQQHTHSIGGTQTTTTTTHHQHHHSHHPHHHHPHQQQPDFDQQYSNYGGGGSDGEQLSTFKEALARRQRAPDLYAFVTDEIARHSKRPASPLDINMDAQQHNIGGKRQRFL